MDALGTIGTLPKKIGDVTNSISKGADSLDKMVGKMDAAIKGVPTYNPVSGAIVGGLSKTTGALKKGTSAISNAGKKIQTVGAGVSTALQPIGVAAQTIKQSLQDLQNCQEIVASSALVVNAVVDSCSGHFHPRINEQVLNKFDGQWDSWAKTINGIYQQQSPTGQANILESLAKGGFGDKVFYLGSAIKNESAGIFGGIADFEDALHAFEGSYRNPIVAAKKIETGVKNIMNAAERVANSINNMVKIYQKGMGQNVSGNPILSYIGNLHNTKAVSAINKALTAVGGTATLFSDASSLQNALKEKDPRAIYSAGKKTIDDAKTIIKGLKDADKARKVTSLAKGTLTGGAAPVDQTAAQQQTPQKDSQDGSGNTDSYVCSGAKMKCSFGDKIAQLTVYPDRTVFLTGQPMANISDHTSLYNIAPFGKCHTTSYPSTGAATAANHGKLTPMPCIPGTNSNWMNGKNDYIIKGDPALLKSSFCRCCYGGVITITDDGQRDTGSADLSRYPKKEFSRNQEVKDFTKRDFVSEEIKKMQEYRAKGLGLIESHMKAIQDVKFENSRNAEGYMSDEDADLRKSNPNYGKNKNYGINCATTTTTFMLRKQGYNVTARPRNANKHTDSIAYGLNLYKMWKNQDGSPVTPIMLSDAFMAKVRKKGLEDELTKLEENKTKLIKIREILANPQINDTDKKNLAAENARLKSLYAMQRQLFAPIYKEVLLESCKEEGYYTFGLVWESVNIGGGHYTVLKSKKDAEGKTVLSNIEPQTGEPLENIDVMIRYLDYPPDADDTIMRTDDKVFNKEYNDLFDIKS